ncbi:MAG: integrase core domain-containing protein [Sphingomonas sp.]|nr:integrase core domain-containing protein [Sphingomonas sp.]
MKTAARRTRTVGAHFGPEAERQLIGNARMRRLNAGFSEPWFASLGHARSVLRAWRDDYNHVRPHSGIGGLTPAEAATQLVQPRPQRVP